MLKPMERSSVLIVEDDEDIRTLYKTALLDAQMTVYTAKDGRDGVELALKHHPSVILMDIMMPNLNGHEAVRKIRADSWGKDAKVIFLTNFSDAENVVYAVEEGSEAYIVKANAEIEEVVNNVRTAMHT